MIAQLALLFIKVIVSAGLTVYTLVMPMALRSAVASVATAIPQCQLSLKSLSVKSLVANALISTSTMSRCTGWLWKRLSQASSEVISENMMVAKLALQHGMWLIDGLGDGIRFGGCKPSAGRPKAVAK